MRYFLKIITKKKKLIKSRPITFRQKKKKISVQNDLTGKNIKIELVFLNDDDYIIIFILPLYLHNIIHVLKVEIVRI